MNKNVVLLPQVIAREAVDFLSEKGYTLRYSRGDAPALLREDIAGCAAALVRSAVYDAAVMDAAAGLRVIAKHGAGVDNIDVDAATARGIRVVNAPLGMTVAVAEYVMACMLALCKCLLPCDAAFRAEGDFSLRYAFPLMEMSGKTILIAGMGRIGCAVARMLSGFEVNILGFDPHVPQERFPANVTRVDDFDGALREADFVTLHMPLLTDTAGFLGARRIGLMKRGAFLINAGRGALVDEGALIDALRDGRLAGAGIDVFEQEPPPPDHPFFSMKNVIVSPHNSALTAQATVRMAMDAAIGIDQVLRGQTPTWPING